MRLELSIEEAAVIRDLLESHLSELSAEIRHTDNPGFREQLRERQAAMRRIATLVADAGPATATG